MANFSQARRQVIQCLESGHVLHEARSNIDVKNLLQVGAVTSAEVVQILKKARGNEHSYSPHHMDANVDVNIVKTSYQGQNWYIKWYFIEPDAVFISVHH